MEIPSGIYFSLSGLILDIEIRIDPACIFANRYIMKLRSSINKKSAHKSVPVFLCNEGKNVGYDRQDSCRLYSLHKAIGNQAIRRFLRLVNQRVSYDNAIHYRAHSDELISRDMSQTSACECDCESYGPYVAGIYARNHLTYPQWFGGSPRPIDLRLYWSHCHYYKRYPAPCSWVSIVVFESPETKTKYTVFVQLVNSNRFYVSTHSNMFPTCIYDYECDNSGNFTNLKLSEVNCRDRMYIPPGL